MEQETPITEEHYRNSLAEARATIARLNTENIAIHYALELALHRAKAAEDTIQHAARVETRCNQTKSSFVTRRNASITNVIDFDHVMHDIDAMRDNLTDDEIGDLYEDGS